MSDEEVSRHARDTHEDLLVEATLKYWWQRRRLISLTMVILVALFTALLLTIPKSYRAQASIIIMPPQFMPEIRTEPLTIITAKSLLETNELYQQVRQLLQRYRNVLVRHGGMENANPGVIQKLSHLTESDLTLDGQMTPEEARAIALLDPSEVQGILEFSDEELAELSVDRLARQLSSEEAIEKKTAADITYSPVLQLYAIAETGNKAQVMVNLWARLFEQKYESLTRGQTQKMFESLERQQDAGQEELEQIQKTLVQFSLQNNLDLIQRQITEHTNSFSSIKASLVTKNTELTTLEAKVESLTALLAALEGDDYSWIGSVLTDNGTSRTDTLVAIQEVGPGLDKHPSAAARRQRLEAARSRNDVIEAYNSAAAFNSANPIALLEAERQRLEDEYLQEKTQYQLNLVKAEVGRKTLAELDRAVQHTSQSVSLHTALPDEVLGAGLAAGRLSEVRKITSIHLNKEQLNPLWETLVKQRSELSQDLQEAEVTVSELSTILPAKEAELRQMSEKIFQAKQAEKLVNLRVTRSDKINETLFASYTTMKDDLFKLGWEITVLKDEILSLEAAAHKISSTIDELRASYEAASAEREILELRKKAVLQQAELLTQKLQESMVAVREEVSDISLASKAVAPTRHFFPPRTLLLGVMTLLSGGILLGGLSRRRYRELMKR